MNLWTWLLAQPWFWPVVTFLATAVINEATNGFPNWKGNPLKWIFDTIKALLTNVISNQPTKPSPSIVDSSTLLDWVKRLLTPKANVKEVTSEMMDRCAGLMKEENTQ